MILASAKPSEYTNGVTSSNRISIGQTDKGNRESFVNRLIPQVRKNRKVLFGFFHPYCKQYVTERSNKQYDVLLT